MSTPGTGERDELSEADLAEEAIYRSLLLPFYVLSLCVSIAALVSLVFTLWIFVRRRDATAGARGMVLLIVAGLFTALSLTVLHVVNIERQVLHAGNETGVTEVAVERRALERFMEAQYVISNTSLLLRNWWVTFLTIVRFVVILFPLRVPEMLTRRRQLAAFFAILTASAAFSIVRHLEEKTCTAHAVAAEAVAAAAAKASRLSVGLVSTPQPLLLTNSSMDLASYSCESFIIFFFVMQTGVPVPTVLVLSVALAVHLFAAREPSDVAASTTTSPTRLTAPVVGEAPPTASHSNSVVSSCNQLTVTGLPNNGGASQNQRQLQPHRNPHARPAKSRSLCRKRKATRILLALAVTFTVLELPTFVYFILMHFFPHFRCSSPGKARLIFSGLNALVTLDTLANFFIFFVFSEAFKREVKKCGCRGGFGRKRQPERRLVGGGGRGVGGGAGGHADNSELQPLRPLSPLCSAKANFS